jgi:GT2 family glycosyltransferase/glycosyltransferase involved in cell wall biosynthesis
VRLEPRRTGETRSALFCTYYVPQTELDSASRRVFHLIEFLRERGWQVSVIAENPVDAEECVPVLEGMGVTVYSAAQADETDLLGRSSFDLAVLCFWHIAERYLARLRQTAPSTRIIVDSGDLHFVRHARRLFAGGHSGRAGLLDAAFGAEATKELNVYAQADCVMTVSAKEAELVRDLCGDPQLAHVVPDCEDLPASRKPFEQRRGMLFIGNFEHPPNAEAVQYLVEEIVPRLGAELLRRHPLTVIGSNFDRLPVELRAARPGIDMRGWVPSVAPHLDAAWISVVPLLHGAGTKRKVIQSLAVGTPTVTTSIGVEGLPIEPGVHVLVGDTPDDFVRCVLSLLDDGDAWQSIAERGRERILASHGREAGRDRFLGVVERVLEREPQRGRMAVQAAATKKTMDDREYHRMVGRLQTLVSQRVPATARVAVVSRGDEDLLQLQVRSAWHFPRTQEGLYTGDHPADGESAILVLEEARAQGVEFLVVPSSAFWWLKFYEDWRRHLERRYSLVAAVAGAGIVVDLRETSRTGGFALDPEIYDVDLGPPDEEGSAAEQVRFFSQAVVPDTGSDTLISVVIPTRNRAPYLSSCLESLAAQTLPGDRYEVIVVNDGSTDDTAAVCASFVSRLRLRHLPIEHAGISGAKNHGARAAGGWIVLFFDDDDVADPDLLLEHARAHGAHPRDEVAVLGYTDWDPSIQVNEVMRHVTDVGHQLFSYQRLKSGEVLDYTYFWGGRASCKRDMLLRHGLFEPAFRFGSEDIELAYRWSRHGFQVVYNGWARQHMIRELTFEQFCSRCEKQGASLNRFSRLHPDPAVQQYCGVASVRQRWPGIEQMLALEVEMTHRVEELLAGCHDGGARDAVLDRLGRLYNWCFEAYRIKGFVEAEPWREEVRSARTRNEPAEGLGGRATGA